METKLISVKKIELNKGQLYGLPKNPRFIRDERYTKLKKSIEDAPEMLELRELLVYPMDNGNFIIIGGNMRYRACLELGFKELPCKVIPLETPVQKLREYTIKDNEGFGQNDWDILTNEWDQEELEDWGVEWQLLESEDENLEIKEEEVTEEDDFDEEKEKIESRCSKGDIWQLGSHRLMCGDSTSKEDFAKLMDGKKADLTFTSPPYNGNNLSSDGNVFNHKVKTLYAEGYKDNLPSSDYVNFVSSVLGQCFDNTEGYIFWNVNYNSNSKFEYIQQIIPFLPYLIEQVYWKKSSAIPLNGCMRRNWEPIYIFSNYKKNIELEKTETNMWGISNSNSQGSDHKACFPVGLPAKGISLVKSRTGIVLEPFGGTGTTIIAAEQLGRKCYAMEIDPHYCDTILARWEKMTGRRANRINK